MRGNFSLLIAAIVLAMQTYAGLHMAEHGFAKHQHHGKICSVFLLAEQGKHGDSFAAPIPLPVSSITVADVSFTIQLATFQRWTTASPRAPPLFS